MLGSMIAELLSRVHRRMELSYKPYGYSIGSSEYEYSTVVNFNHRFPRTSGLEAPIMELTGEIELLDIR